MEELEIVLIDEEKKPIEKGKKKKNKLVITCLVLDILALIGYFITYGPWNYARNLLVTTAMTTMNHKYLARIFYSDATIREIMNANYVLESGDSTDISQITFIENDTGIYESIYEEQILKRDKDDVYKLIPISGNNYKGTLVAIYDASKVELALSKYFGTWGQYVTTITRENDALIGINASAFEDDGWSGNGSKPTGVVIMDGKIVYQGISTGYGGGIIGFTEDNVLMLTKKSASQAIAEGLEDGVEFGPFLIVNGEPSFIKGNGGWGIAPRTAIAQRKDGIVLFLVIDGRRPGHSLGIDMTEMTKILLNYGAYNAANLDGGSSSVLSVKGELYNRPTGSTETGERSSPNAWIVK